MTTQSQETAIAKQQKNVADQVLNRVSEFQKMGQLRIPDDYSPENALKSAWLLLLESKTKEGKPVLEACSKESIANALLNMVVQGLSPMKSQCAFIAYGGKLEMQRQYQGTLALAKRYAKVKDVRANVVYEKDEFQYEVLEDGRKKVTKHVSGMDNIDLNKIKGAYATLILEDGTTETEVMTMTQIYAAWQQGATKGSSPAHKNFPDQMAMKTVINRACKLKIQASDDSVLGIGDEDERDYVVEASREEIEANANKETIGFDEVEEAEEVKEEPEKVKEAAVKEEQPDWMK